MNFHSSGLRKSHLYLIRFQITLCVYILQLVHQQLVQPKTTKIELDIHHQQKELDS